MVSKMHRQRGRPETLHDVEREAVQTLGRALCRQASCLVVCCLAIIMLSLFAPSPGHGDVIELYGEENVGTAGAQFLRIPVGARAVGLGKAFTACATDGAALFWNPAGIMRTLGRKTVFLSHNQYAADIDLNYFSYHWHRQNFGWGLLFGMLDSGDIPRTDEFHQEGTGQTFTANQYFVGLSLARSMTDRFSIGGTVKLYQENLDEFTVRTWLLDVGILYYVGLGDLRVGFAAKNFGPDLKPNGTPPAVGDNFRTPGDFQKFSAPTEGSFGAAYTLHFGKLASLLTTVDFNHPSDYSESFRMGGELGLLKVFRFRVGYETNRSEGGLAAGFGVDVEGHSWGLRVDYGYSDMGTFGMIHHFSLDLAPVIKRRSP